MHAGVKMVLMTSFHMKFIATVEGIVVDSTFGSCSCAILVDFSVKTQGAKVSP